MTNPTPNKPHTRVVVLEQGTWASVVSPNGGWTALVHHFSNKGPIFDLCDSRGREIFRITYDTSTHVMRILPASGDPMTEIKVGDK